MHLCTGAFTAGVNPLKFAWPFIADDGRHKGRQTHWSARLGGFRR